MTPDQVIAVTQLIFTVALFPTLIDSKSMVARVTSAITAAGLWLIAIQYWRLDLYLAMSASAAAALIWTLIFIFRPVRA